MMKILVPIDFSFCSRNAALYAAYLARDLHASLCLFHLVNFESPPLARISVTTEEKIEDLQLANATQEAEELIADLKEKFPHLTITFHVDRGQDLGESIEHFCLKETIELIVMGTKGVTGLKKIFLGSQSHAIMQKSPLPVMTIPEMATYQGIQKILFPFSEEINFQNHLEKITNFANLFKAEVQLLFFQTEPIGSNANLQTLQNKIKQDISDDRLSFSAIKTSHLYEDLATWIKEKKPDVLTLLIQPSRLLDKIIKGDFSDEIISYPLLPLLTFKTSEE